MDAQDPRTQQDMRTIALVGLAHATSHFHHLLLPPLFPTFITEFGLSWSQLGLLVTLCFVISGLGQALAGLGNCPFHPADFTVLNKRVSPRRLGHAFSVHGICGNMGWAVAPLFMVGVAQGTGQWRLAYVASALLVLGLLMVLWWRRRDIDDRSVAPALAKADAAAAPVHTLAFLRLPSVWLCFSFFFWSTAALSAIQSFAGPALAVVYGMPLSSAASVVTAYMLCSAAGMVLGGYWAAAWPGRRATCSSRPPRRLAPRAVSTARCTRGWTSASLSRPLFLAG